MTTKLYFYGSEFELSTENDDTAWRAIIEDRFRVAEESGGQIIAWFDLAGGGHVTIPISSDTPLAITTD